MATWFTSDTHFGHKNILKYCPDRLKYCSDVRHMDRVLIERWNAKIQPDDIVWHLGDVFFCGNTYGQSILNELNGRKRLIMGNHDYSRSYSKWESLGFEFVLEAAQIKIDGKDCWLSHYPYSEGFWKVLFKRFHYDDRYIQKKLKDSGAWLFHGHIHDIWKVKDRMINVGVDVWDGEPVSEDQVIKIMRNADGFNRSSR